MNTKKKTLKKIVRKKAVSKNTKTKSAKLKPKMKLAAVLGKKEAKRTRTIAAMKKIIRHTKTGVVSQKQKITLRHGIYIILSAILGSLLGIIARLSVEFIYLRESITQGELPEPNNFMGAKSYLPVPFAVLFLLGGLAFGIWLGFWGWKILYREHRR